jgi:hypothetical protein
MLPNQQIQQLEYDGTRLFCPANPTRELEPATTESEQGAFMMVCTAPVPGVAGATCSRSAQWQDKEAMHQELEQAN